MTRISENQTVRFAAFCASWLFGIATAFLESTNTQAFEVSDGNTIKSCAAHLPADTIALLYCSEPTRLIKEFATTGVGKGFLRTPQMQMFNFAIENFRDEVEPNQFAEPALAEFDSPVEITTDLLKGPCWFAVMESGETLHWIASLGINPDCELAIRVRKTLLEKNEYGILQFENREPEAAKGFNKDSARKATDKKSATDRPDDFPLIECRVRTGRPRNIFYQSPPPERWIYVRLGRERLELASHRDVFAQVGNPRRSLANSRRFQQMARQCAFDTAAHELDGYLNFSEVLQLTFDPKIQEKEKATSLLELLTFGMRVYVNDGEIEIGIDAYLTHALPGIGLNQYFQFEPLDQPINAGIPDTADIYCKANIKMDHFASGLKALDEALKQDFGQPSMASGAIAVYSPLLALISQSQPDQFNLRELSGEFDVFGTVADTGNSMRTLRVERLRISEFTDQDKLLDSLKQNIPIFSQLRQKEFNGTPYLTSSDETIAQHRSNKERMLERGLKPPEGDIEPQTLTVFGGYLMFFFRQSDMHAFFSEESREDLETNKNLERVWKVLDEYQRPGFVVLVKGAELFRPLYRWLRLKHFGGSDWADFRMKVLEGENQVDTTEYKYWKKSLDSSSDWSYDHFRRPFGPGGLGIYQRPQGILIRAVQLSK